ncbi:MAG: hypothetical protein SGPRY_002840 [Prymnesium sp.]
MLQATLICPWSPREKVSCVQESDKFVAFQRNYRFQCRVCVGGEEKFELLPNSWTSIVLTAVYNLLLSDNGTTLGDCTKWLKIKEIAQWIEQHSGSLTTGRDVQRIGEVDTVLKSLQRERQPRRAPLITQTDLQQYTTVRTNAQMHKRTLSHSL